MRNIYPHFSTPWLISILILSLYAFSSCNQARNQSDQTSDTDSAYSRSGTVRLYQQNPRYLEYMGKPIILITSAEHYGAVLNLDFDYKVYLETLAKEGFNYTRIFGGTYIEPVDNIFGIRKNTLAPSPGRFMAPWVRLEGSYDLDQFNPEYFERLKGFISEAGKREIIVEVTLFTSIYAENAWQLSPFNSINNRNEKEVTDFRKVNTLYNGPLKRYQESYIRKLVREVNQFDNLFFEIQNEPWSDNPNLTGYVNEGDSIIFTSNWQKRIEVANGVSAAWQAWVVSVIRDEESKLPKKHLIAQNISNFQSELESLPGGVSIINFHYALPEAVTENSDLGGMIGLDETGFMPHDDVIYLKQAWRFLLAGGGLYNNLDYSFTAGNETGTWPIPPGNPGWGGPGFREKLSFLARTIHSVPFYEMEFSSSVLKDTGPGSKQFGLAKQGEVYLVLLEDYGPDGLSVQIPGSDYHVTWIDIESGQTESNLQWLDDGTSLSIPFNADPVAVLIRKSDPDKTE